MAQLYSYLDRETEATVQDAMDELDLAQGTAYTYVNQLVDGNIVEMTDETQPRRYTAMDIDLTVGAAAGDREYTLTPALIDAVGRRDRHIDTYIDRHGIVWLTTALTYAIEREQGTMTHRLMAQDLNISPLAAGIILQALYPVVHEHYDIEESEVSLDAINSGYVDATDDARARSISSIPVCSWRWAVLRTTDTRTSVDSLAVPTSPSSSPNGCLRN